MPQTASAQYMNRQDVHALWLHQLSTAHYCPSLCVRWFLRKVRQHLLKISSLKKHITSRRMHPEGASFVHDVNEASCGQERRECTHLRRVSAIGVLLAGLASREMFMRWSSWMKHPVRQACFLRISAETKVQSTLNPRQVSRRRTLFSTQNSFCGKAGRMRFWVTLLSGEKAGVMGSTALMKMSSSFLWKLVVRELISEHAESLFSCTGSSNSGRSCCTQAVRYFWCEAFC